MPELPDIRLYLHALRPRVVGAPLAALDLTTPFLLRTVTPPPSEFVGQTVTDVSRLGKRIVFAFSGDRYLVLHLMIAGRLRWFPAGQRPKGPKPLMILMFPSGRLALTEAGTKRRASVHLVAGRTDLGAFDRGGLDLETASFDDFQIALARENHTLKRALTDPTIIDGVGNAYSDEILHRARLSPFLQTRNLDSGTLTTLLAAAKGVLREWTDQLQAEVGSGWPEKVTAFREGMAVHGRYGMPCPVCGTPVQRIRYAENETNYCPGCQTNGRLLADRGLSRLLREDWPRTLAELEDRLRPS